MSQPIPNLPSPTSGIPPKEVPSIWLNRSLLLLLALFFLVLGFRWYRDHYSTRPLELSHSPKHLVDLNRASIIEIEQLPGIGPQTAERIVKFRQETGRFCSLEDLKQVGGIGDRTISKIRPWVFVGQEASAEKLNSEPDTLKRSSTKVTASHVKSSISKPSLGAGRLNVNSASAEELQKLPGIGVVLAQRIIDARTSKPFQTIEDLRRVSGIGAKKLEAIRDLITFAD